MDPTSPDSDEASLVIATARSGTWLLDRTTAAPDLRALIPPGTARPDGERSTRWTCWTSAAGAPKEIRAAVAIRESHGYGYARWAIEQTLDYAHLLLELVEERVAADGRLENEVCSAFADPALDLLVSLRELATDDELKEIMRATLEQLPLLAPGVIELDEVAMREALLA